MTTCVCGRDFATPILAALAHNYGADLLVIAFDCSGCGRPLEVYWSSGDVSVLRAPESMDKRESRFARESL